MLMTMGAFLINQTNFDFSKAASIQVRPPVAAFKLDVQRLLEGGNLNAAVEPTSRLLYLIESALKPITVVEMTVGESDKMKLKGFRTEEFTQNFAREYGVTWGNAQYATDSRLPAGPYEIRMLEFDSENEGIWFKAKGGAADFICSLSQTSWGLQIGKLYTFAEIRSMLAASVKEHPLPSTRTTGVDAGPAVDP